MLDPKYANLDSVYIDSRGFPCAMWARNDPAVSGTGEAEEAIVKNNPPKLGDIVTFKYYDLTKNNKPKFASFLRIRQKE